MEGLRAIIHVLKNIIDNYANLFTSLGLIISILTLYKVWSNKKELEKLNKKNYAKNRMPENLDNLKQISSQISTLNSMFEQNKIELNNEIVKIRPILKSLRKSLSQEDLEYVRNLDKILNKPLFFNIEDVPCWRKLPLYKKYLIVTENKVDEVYIKLTAVITDIDVVSKDNNKNLL